MERYDWPGNVRELQNAIHRYITFKTIDLPEISQTEPVEAEDLEDDSKTQSTHDFDLRNTMEDFEKKIIRGVLEHKGGNRSQTAKALGIVRRSLQRKMKRYHLT
jgi:transcriptional regulator with PAS, ATPase and Fis domain